MKTKLDIKDKPKWFAIAAAVGVLSGLASAVFLHLLNFVTRLREANSWLVLLLPVGGVLIAWIYERYGREVERGNNLLLEEIHQPNKTVPLLMAPLVLLGTLLSHLFGASSGREGTAVQMGGSLADQLSKPLRLQKHERKKLLMMGMSAGFGSVFGVPFAGAVFGLEVLTIGRIEFALIAECLLASFVGHLTCLALLVSHTQYPAPEIITPGILALAGVAVAGVIFGLAARAFVLLSHVLSSALAKALPRRDLRAFTGGVILVVGFYILGTTRFAGLGIPVIVESLRAPIPQFDFAWKTLFTALSLSSGFKGGEVTPLLYIGATLGNSLASWIALPFSLLAVIGLVAVFAGAANTPWACAVMAMELFGWRIGVYAVIGCWLSFFVSSSRGIYSAQLPGRWKVRNLLARVWRRP